MHQISVFISHSWSYSEHYQKLREWIFETDWYIDKMPIRFSDKSIPKDNPIHYANNAKELRHAIFTKIQVSNVVVIPTGMYSSHSKWIQEEINGALEFSKPILAVNPWGQERKSSVVVNSTPHRCGWNSQKVVEKIWALRNG